MRKLIARKNIMIIQEEIMRKMIAILLAVLFLVSLTASAVSASHPVLKRGLMTAGAVSGQRWGPENKNIAMKATALSSTPISTTKGQYDTEQITYMAPIRLGPG
jgi:hypothetical protein